MGIEIDIKTRVFDDEDRAYRLFPGQGYRHYRTMQENSVVFRDNPGLSLPGITGYNKSDAMLTEIARSEDKQPYVNANSENLEAELRALDEKDYTGIRWSKRRELSLGWLNALYSQASIGDLVVVPSPGIIRNAEGEWEKAYTLVGEIISEPERWNGGNSPKYARGRYIVRRVRWLAEVNELELDVNTQLGLRTQNALITIRARAFERVLGAAYKNIVLGDEYLARFVTTNPEFTAFENYHFNAFVMAVVAACRKIENNEGAWEDTRSIYDIAADVERTDQLVPDQESSIHSPGYMTLRGSILFPAVMSALFALALEADADPFAGDGPNSVTVVNSESAAFDPCDVGIEQGVREALIIMGYDRWQQACRAGHKSNDNEGLQSITTVTTTPDEE